MIFDTLISIVERHFPNEFGKLVEDARLFIFPGKAHEVLPKRFERDVIDYIREYFVLPFDTVAVEDSASCVILKDLEKDAVGSSAYRQYIECLPIAANPEEFAMGRLSSSYEMMKEYTDEFMITSGKIRFESVDEVGFLSEGRVDFLALCSKKEVLLSPVDLALYRVDPTITRPCMLNAKTALEEIMYFNNPSRFILEEEPINKRGKGKKIPRSPDRSKYVLLTPDEIRTKFGLSEGGHGKVAPHERRRHPRILRSEKFVHKRGQTIIIPATWVGASEAIIGNTRYKVRLDL